jgi:hypothetical protein
MHVVFMPLTFMNSPFDFKIRSENRVLGLQRAPPASGWVCCNLFKWRSLTCGWLGMLQFCWIFDYT